MDELRTGFSPPPPLDRSRVKVTASVEVQAGVHFAVVTDSAAPDSICTDLADGRFPASTREAVEYLQELTPPGGRVLDLGTHVGSFTLAAAALGYEVVGVEASPTNAALLHASIEENGYDRVRLIHAAVSDRRGSLEFSHGGPYGHVGIPGEGLPTVSVAAWPVDDLMAELGWDRVDFIKMDIEGSEIAGLRGMKRLLRGPKAAPLFIESNGHTLGFYDQTPQRMKAELEAFGYRNYLVEMGRLCPVRVEDFQPVTCVDLMAVKRPLKDLRTVRVDRPLSDDEIVFRIVQTSRSPQFQERGYIARALCQASPSILSASQVHEAVEALRNDSRSEVRAAAAAIPLRPVRRSWFSRWHRGLGAIPRPHVLKARAARTDRSGSPRG